MSIVSAIRNHPLISAGLGTATIGAGAVAIAGTVRRKRKKKATTTRRKKTTTCKTKRKTTTASKRRRTKVNTKKIYKTKTGQPYIKMANGKCKFISKRSARMRKKRKGGYY